MKPSLEEYLVVDSRSRGVTLYRRNAGEVVATWPAETVHLASIGCEISLERLYDGIALPAAE